MFDRFNRQINYLRISVTDRCNLLCRYCMPSEGVKLKTPEEILSYEEITKIARAGARMGITKIRLTGGEPLVRKEIHLLVKALKEISDIKEVTLTTNGVLLERMAKKLKRSGLDRINISLDTLDSQKYRELTRGGDIKWVMKGIDAAIASEFDNIKLNMVIIPGFNVDEVAQMKTYCKKKGLQLQRINHYSLINKENLDPQYKTERPLSCDQCNRIRLTAEGKLKPCLFSNQEYPVDFSNIESCIKMAILNKPELGTGCTVRGNWEIGG